MIRADDRLPPFEEASRAVAVSYGGELLGALSLHKPPNEPLTSTEDELMRHLASQAGLGGALQVRSQPGHGTILSGELPVSAPDPG